MTPLELHPGDMVWCPEANGGKGAVVGPLRQRDPDSKRHFTDGLNTWRRDGSAFSTDLGPITAIAVPLPADAPVGARWQCVMGRYCGHVFKFPFGGYLLNMVPPTDLFIRLPDAAPELVPEPLEWREEIGQRLYAGGKATDQWRGSDDRH